MQTHRFCQEIAETLPRFCLVQCKTGISTAERVPAADPHFCWSRGSGLHHQTFPTTQLANAIKHRLGSMISDAPEQEIMDAGQIHAGRQAGKTDELFDLGAEGKATALRLGKIQWLDAEAISRRKKTFFQIVPQHKGKHAPQTCQSGFGSPEGQCAQQDLGIGGGAEPLATRFKITAQFLVVVDLAVEDNMPPTRFLCHGLSPGFIQTYDRQTAMSQT